jgi:hypothetical protein
MSTGDPICPKCGSYYCPSLRFTDCGTIGICPADNYFIKGIQYYNNNLLNKYVSKMIKEGIKNYNNNFKENKMIEEQKQPTTQDDNYIEIPLSIFSRVAIDVLKKNFEFIDTLPEDYMKKHKQFNDSTYFGKSFYIEDKEVKIIQLLKKAFKTMKKDRTDGKRISLYKAYLVPTAENNKKYSVMITYYI